MKEGSEKCIVALFSLSKRTDIPNNLARCFVDFYHHYEDFAPVSIVAARGFLMGIVCSYTQLVLERDR